jgi:hypothetical protein
VFVLVFPSLRELCCKDSLAIMTDINPGTPMVKQTNKTPLPACVCACISLLQVLWCKDSLAIMTGINPDAPLGTKLAFVSGGSG